jgi:hypothetical protein
MIGRIPYVLFVLTAWLIGVLYFLDVHFDIPIEEAIMRELRPVATTEELDRRVNEALANDDLEDAQMYLEIADYMERVLPEETHARLQSAMTRSATVARNTAGFASGFVSGEGLTTAEIAGAVTSDLTVVGDIRDITEEGSKMLRGHEYNRLVLGLSVVGLAATGATVATGGGGIPAKLGVSILKVGARIGTLTAEFAATLLRLSRQAVNMNGVGTILARTGRADFAGAEDALIAYSRSVRDADIFPVVTKLGALGDTVGPGETVRLLRYVRTTENLDDVALMSTRLGKKTRGVIELTGKASLRAFRTSLNVLEMIIEWVVAFAAWIASLITMSITHRAIRLARRANRSV